MKTLIDKEIKTITNIVITSSAYYRHRPPNFIYVLI